MKVYVPPQAVCRTEVRCGAVSTAPRSTSQSTSHGSSSRPHQGRHRGVDRPGRQPRPVPRSHRLPDGDYPLTYWDEPQDYILDLLSVTVGQRRDRRHGHPPLAGWWTKFEGYVFNDTNRNGERDPGEAGVPNFGLTLRTRENSLMDRGSTAVSTDQSGHYKFEQAYPLTNGSSSRRTTTAGTRPASRTRRTTRTSRPRCWAQGVDVSVLPIIGLGARIDWGVHAYDASGTANGVDPQNGGIVGSISYDTTRNELDPQYAAAEDWQPGVSDITVELYRRSACGTNAGDAVRRQRRLRAQHRRVISPRHPAEHLHHRDLGAADRLRRARCRRRSALEPGRASRSSRSIRARAAWKARSWASVRSVARPIGHGGSRTSVPPWTATMASATSASTGRPRRDGPVAPECVDG